MKLKGIPACGRDSRRSYKKHTLRHRLAPAVRDRQRRRAHRFIGHRRHRALQQLDVGFVQAVLSYSTHRASLDEQVAATNEVIEAAKAVAVKKGADAVTKAGTKSAQRVAVPKAAAGDDDADDEHGGDGADDAPATPPAVVPAATSAAGSGVPDLFGA